MAYHCEKSKNAKSLAIAQQLYVASEMC